MIAARNATLPAFMYYNGLEQKSEPEFGVKLKDAWPEFNPPKFFVPDSVMNTNVGSNLKLATKYVFVRISIITTEEAMRDIMMEASNSVLTTEVQHKIEGGESSFLPFHLKFVLVVTLASQLDRWLLFQYLLVLQDPDLEAAVSCAISGAIPPTPAIIPIPIAAARGSISPVIATSSTLKIPSVSISLLGVSLMNGISLHSSSLDSGEVATCIPAQVTVSQSFPPVPGKVAERIRSGMFVEIKELMPDNAALKLQSSDVGANLAGSSPAKLREVDDPLATFLAYFQS
uniref:Uncharacterized protein n=1 Tax=Amphimedon queenslandica TaxID=400682 RepID=A0A1X7T113_AMPQE